MCSRLWTGQKARSDSTRCITDSGRRRSADDLEEFELLVSRFEKDTPLREPAQMALSRLQDPHGYNLWWLRTPNSVATRPWYVLFPVLSAGTLALVLLVPFWPPALPALIAVVVVNLVVRYLTDFPIATLAGAFRQLAPVIATAESLRTVATSDVQTLVGALASDTPRLHRLKTIARWITGEPLLLPIRSGSLELLVNDVVIVVYEYLNLFFLLDACGVYFGAGELRRHGDALLRVTAAVGEVDAAISVASFRAGRLDWTRPTFTEPREGAVWRDIRHPLIQDAVPNTLSLPLGTGALVTGSNMSGKSTFLRTIGVTTVMAQTLNTCLAARYEAPVFRVRSCIGRSDNLLSGTSYYIAEVEALLELVAAAGVTTPQLFIIDELFRGTNTIERIAAAQAALRELVRDVPGLTSHVAIAATHDAELVDLLAGTYGVYHFGDALGSDGLSFDHRLEPGRATTRNAIGLLRLHGAPDTLIDHALACAAALDRQRSTVNGLPG